MRCLSAQQMHCQLVVSGVCSVPADAVAHYLQVFHSGSVPPVCYVEPHFCSVHYVMHLLMAFHSVMHLLMAFHSVVCRLPLCSVAVFLHLQNFLQAVCSAPDLPVVLDVCSVKEPVFLQGSHPL